MSGLLIFRLSLGNVPTSGGLDYLESLAGKKWQGLSGNKKVYLKAWYFILYLQVVFAAFGAVATAVGYSKGKANVQAKWDSATADAIIKNDLERKRSVDYVATHMCVQV